MTCKYLFLSLAVIIVNDRKLCMPARKWQSIILYWKLYSIKCFS